MSHPPYPHRGHTVRFTRARAWFDDTSGAPAPATEAGGSAPRPAAVVACADHIRDRELDAA